MGFPLLIFFSLFLGTTRLDEIGMSLFPALIVHYASCVVRTMSLFCRVCSCITTDAFDDFVYPGYKKRFVKPTGPRSCPAAWPSFRHLGLQFRYENYFLNSIVPFSSQRLNITCTFHGKQHYLQLSVDCMRRVKVINSLKKKEKHPKRTRDESLVNMASIIHEIFHINVGKKLNVMFNFCIFL